MKKNEYLAPEMEIVELNGVNLLLGFSGDTPEIDGDIDGGDPV